MSIYKGIDHALHFRLKTHGLSELGIRRPPKDVVPQQDPLHLVSTRRTMLWQLPQTTRTLHSWRSHCRTVL